MTAIAAGINSGHGSSVRTLQSLEIHPDKISSHWKSKVGNRRKINPQYFSATFSVDSAIFGIALVVHCYILREKVSVMNRDYLRVKDEL